MKIGRKVKTLKGTVYAIVIAGLLAGMLTGCNPSTAVAKETDERAYRRGKSLLREGRQDEALQAFLSVISSRADPLESHLEAGLIYLNHIKDPLAAIYHFKSYLTLNPQAEHADLVKELILTAEKDFVETLPGQPFGDAVERVNLMDKVRTLQEENTQLKQQVLTLQKESAEQESVLLRYQQVLNERQETVSSPNEVAPIIIQTPGATVPEAPDTPETYTVEAGDTLSNISRKVYGTPGRWMDIFQANRDLLPSPNALKPGQVLRIP
jgi:LysM repeat protein